jgi:hypothetical protein
LNKTAWTSVLERLDSVLDLKEDIFNVSHSK